MKPRSSDPNAQQGDFFKVLLSDIVSANHPLIQLGEIVDWQQFEQTLGEFYCEDNGRPGSAIRLMVGLHYLKFTFDLSDEQTLLNWVENPYWQRFCGGIYFEHKPPIDSSSMTKWRSRLKDAGLENLLAETIRAGLRSKLIRPGELQRVNVDTTVQEKAIRFPTDARTCDRMRERLVKVARDEGVVLRQSYRCVGKRTLRRQSNYARVKQFKRAAKQTKKLKTILGRVVRDIVRKHATPSEQLQELLNNAQRLLQQEKKSKNKIYSVHEPQVECISKGKAHKRYEFGCKVGLTTSATGNWVLSAQAFHGNPYDGHTLKQCLEQAESLTGVAIKQATVDLGYRKHNYDGECNVLIADRYRNRASKTVLRWWKRRSAIEPVIGHLKSDHGMNRNEFKGTDGDQINALLASCGFNLRKLLKRLSFLPFVSHFQRLLVCLAAHSWRMKAQNNESRLPKLQRPSLQAA